VTLPLTKLTRYCNVIVIGGGELWGTGGYSYILTYPHQLGQPLEVELDHLGLKVARHEGRHLTHQ
jgi:hypothetical protein